MEVNTPGLSLSALCVSAYISHPSNSKAGYCPLQVGFYVANWQLFICTNTIHMLPLLLFAFLCIHQTECLLFPQRAMGYSSNYEMKHSHL